jgi:hypothetical protein
LTKPVELPQGTLEIYIRPAGEHRYTALDDLSETSLKKLSADGFNPCAVVETSAGNFQAWLKHSVVFPKLLSTFTAQTLRPGTMQIRVRRTGDVSEDFQVLQTANQNTEDQTDFFPSCDSRATEASNIQSRRTSRAK